MIKRPWTTTDVQRLKELAPHNSIRKIATELGRSRLAVARYASTAGIPIGAIGRPPLPQIQVGPQGELMLGRLGRVSLSIIAEKAARAIVRHPNPRDLVITVSPDNDVCLELVSIAVEDEIVGCYVPDINRCAGAWISVAASIERDLRDYLP